MQLAKVLPVPLSPTAAHHYHPWRAKKVHIVQNIFLEKLRCFSYIAGILPSNHEVQSRHNLRKMTKNEYLVRDFDLSPSYTLDSNLSLDT